MRFKMIAILYFFFIQFNTVFAATKYIRSGATGTGDGSSIANAYPSFGSVVWDRNNTYYICGGVYNEIVTIGKEESGSTWLVIKKYNKYDNGNDTDWNPDYAAAQAVINGRVILSNAYINFNGVTGDLNSGHGIKVKKYPCGTDTHVVTLENGKSNIELSHTEIEGCGMSFSASNDFNEDGVYANNAENYPTTGQNFSYLYIHDVPRDGITMVGNRDSIIQNCWLSNMINSGGLRGIHGQAIAFIIPPMDNIIVRNSFFKNIDGTAALALLGSNELLYNNILFYNNVLWSTDKTIFTYSPAAIFGRSQTSQSNILSYNNTFFNIKNPTTGMYGTTISGNQSKNNLYVNCEFQFNHIGVTQSNNDYYSNIGENIPVGENNQATESSDPFIDSSNSNFRLNVTSNAISNGVNFSSVFTTDIVGTLRDSNWDIGAYEYYITHHLRQSSGSISGGSIVAP